MLRLVRFLRRAAPTVLAVSVLVQAVLYVVLLAAPERSASSPRAQLLLVTSVPLWLVAVAALERWQPRRVAAVVLGVGALLSLVALLHAPATSDDDFRYLWDGKVQLAGTDPYRYPPSSPALAHLRGPFLFGPPGHDPHGFPGGSTMINRPTVRTIYPPVAQAAFTVLRLLSFGGRGGHLPLQLAGTLGLLAVGWLLLRSGVRPWLAAVWTWCPVTIVEYANNAHIDWLGVLLVVAAFVLARRRFRTGVIGVLVGAAIAVKLYPALVLPALMRRRWLVAPVAVVTVAVSYVPHVLAVGGDVIGYLPGYLQEEQYGSGGRLLLLGQVLPHPADTAVGLLVVAAVSVWAWRRGDRERPERAAVVVVGVTFCVFTPSYGWYAGLLLALVALTGAVEWIPVVLAATGTYLLHADQFDPLIYAGAVVLAIGIARIRRHGRRSVEQPREVAVTS